MRLSALFLSFFLLATPAMATEACYYTPSVVSAELSSMASNIIPRSFTGTEAKEFNAALEEVVGAKNANEFDSVTAYNLMYQGTAYVVVVYFKDGCATTKSVLPASTVEALSNKLAERHISYP